MPLPRNRQIRLVGQKIRQIRKSRHLTQADLAARIGVTQSDLSRMENGEYKVGLDILFRILQVFELSMSQFFGEPAPAEPPSPPAFPDDPELSRDWEALAPEARREVREFIAFKKLQTEFRRSVQGDTPPPALPRLPEPGAEGEDGIDAEAGGTDDDDTDP
ncbi:MAG: helix-turn-helix domain-containing protein [Acidithiobacillales bacterium]